MADLASLVIKVDSRDANRAKTSLDSLATTAGRTERATDGMGRGFRQGARDAGMLGSAAGAAAINVRTLGAAAAAAAVVAGTRGFISMADDVSMLSARINLLSKSTTAYHDVQSELLRVANSAQTSLSAVGQLYSRLITPITKLGGTSREALGIVESLSAALLMSGASAEESASVIRQFSQAMGKGKLNGDEFISIAENAPIVLRAMEDQLGKTTAEIYAMAEAGELTAALVGNTMLNGIETFTAGAAAMPQTVAGAMTRLKNEFTVAADEINKSGGITGGITDIINLVSRIVPIVKDGVIAGIKQFQGFLERNKDTVSAIKDAFSITAQVVGMVGSAIFGVLGMVIKVATESGLIKGIFNAIAGTVQIVANGIAIMAAGIVKAGDFVIEKLGNPLQDIIVLLEKAARAVGLDGIASSLASADKAFDKSRSTAVAWADSISAKVKAGNFNVLGFSLATDKAAEAAKKATPDFVKLGEGAAEAGKAGAAELKKMQKAAEDAAAAIERVLQAQRADISKSVLGEQGAARADFAASGASTEQQGQFAQSQAMLEVLAMVDKAWADIDASQKTAAESAAKYIDDFLAKDFGSNLAAGFDKAGQSLGAFVNGFGKLIESQEMYNKMRLAAGGDAIELATIDARQKANELGLYADLAGAAKGLTKEKSTGYKALAKIEQGLRISQIAHSAWEKKDEAIKLAMKLKGYAQDLGAFIASIPVKIAGFLGIGSAAGAAATAAAAIQPGPAAFVGFAAMAAMIASIGLGGKGGKGPGFTDNTGTGTVFGDAGAQSESISKSIDLLGDAATLENRISSAMLASLRNIEANIGGLTNLVIRNAPGGDLAEGVGTGFKMSGFGSALAAGTGGIFNILTLGLLKPFGNALGKLIGGLFGSKTKITGQGLTAVPQTLEDILGDGFELLNFVAIQTKKKALGITTSTKNSIRTSLADPTLANQFTLIFSNIFDSLAMAAGPLGMEIGDKLTNFIVDIGKINLKGLKGDEIQEKLTAVFGAAADAIAAAAFAGLGDFQKVGEGYFETVIRVASGIEQASTLLDRLGVSAISYTDIIAKQGDVTTEIIRQSVLLQDATTGIAGGFAEIVGNFDGTGEEITDLVMQLRDLQDSLIATGKAGQFLTTFMIAGAGGVDRLTDGLSTYFNDFLTPAEQAAELTRRLTDQFVRAGQTLPTSIDGFKALVQSLDISTEAGQRMYGQVIALAPAFVDLQDSMQTAAESTNSLVSSLRDLADEARKQSAASAPVQNLSSLRAQFQAASNRAGLGDATAAASLPEIGKLLLQSSRDYSASSTAYLSDLALITAGATRAADVQDRGMGFTPESGFTGQLASNATSAPTETAASAEVAALRQEMNANMFSLAKYAQRTADLLERWSDGDRMNVRIDNEATDPALVRTVA